MRNYFFILILLLFSCTAKKKQPIDAYEDLLQDTVVAKDYVYVDTPEEVQKTIAPAFDTGTTIVQAPVEEIYDEDEEVQDTIEVDTTVYRWQLTVATDTVAAWKKMKQFAYVEKLDSLLKAAKEKKKKEQKKQPQKQRSAKGGGSSDDFVSSRDSGVNSVFASSGLQIVLWVLAGAFVLFVIYKLFVTGSPMQRRQKTEVQAPQAAEEIITPESDFDRMIREAVQKNNYRLAVRYHYLQTLHTLAQKNYLRLAADKTNYSYVHEIADYNKQNEFAALTLNYEYVWYGEFVIDEMVYLKLKPAFVAFNSKI
jgi:preprotein translocase subunit SecG